jgi:hypothetical protein
MSRMTRVVLLAALSFQLIAIIVLTPLLRGSNNDARRGGDDDDAPDVFAAWGHGREDGHGDEDGGYDYSDNDNYHHEGATPSLHEGRYRGVEYGADGDREGRSIRRMPPPPESLEVMNFCAEKCRYLHAMCDSGLYLDGLAYPAPHCLNRSQSIEDDIYWMDLPRNGGNGTLTRTRNDGTTRLVDWAAKMARRRVRTNATINNGFATDEDSNAIRRCEEIHTANESPMMFPEEFEFVVKLFANMRPDTYLEWGTGMSTSFYPLLASGTVIAIDGYPPWCDKVMMEPRVRCMMEDEGRLHFTCPELVGADGTTRLALRAVGKLPPNTPDEDVVSAMRIYVDSVVEASDEAGVTKYDVALVDGRFRLQCALRLLPYLHDDSVLLMHDFWVRFKAYRIVLEYFNVIGYARSVVALKKKGGIMSTEEERTVYDRYMTREHLTWTDLA